MKIVYQSRDYAPERVTGRYIRCEGRKPNYVFRVFETMNGVFNGAPGRGPTIREYDTDGTELPDELRARCIASKSTEKWD
jgi:hypothetical protein